MVAEGKGRLFKRKDNKYLVYLPVDLCQDSMFPFKLTQKGERGEGLSLAVKVRFTNGANPKIIIESWTPPEQQTA